MDFFTKLSPGVISWGINNFMKEDGNIRKREGGIKSGTQAFKNKTGIHALSDDEKQNISIKGKNAFLEKMKDPEYAAEHGRKIREAHARRKHQEQKKKDSFGFY